jgi:ADP-heptose:LPS heptosyltransferase
MKVTTMRRVDRWLGIPAAAALTLVRRLRSEEATDRVQSCEKIVFIKLAEQGSTVLATSAIRRAVELVGRGNVYFLVFEENRFILETMELIPAENIIAIRTNTLAATIFDALLAIRELRRRGIDTAIDLEFFARASAVLAFLSLAKRRVGFHAFGEGPYRGDLMTHRLVFNNHIHISQLFRIMVEALNVAPASFPAFSAVPSSVAEPPPVFEATTHELDEVRKLLRKAARSEEFSPLILLNANCGDLLPLRRWPEERYVELAKRLLERYPAIRVAFTGAPAEAEQVARLVERIGSDRCYSLAGRTTLRQLLVTYCLAEVLVTNDSGPAHFSALTPIDVITLFGPETPKLFAARTPRSHVFWEGIACSPCVNAYNGRTSACKDNVCMQRIDVERVFQQTCQLYERRLQGRENR